MSAPARTVAGGEVNHPNQRRLKGLWNQALLHRIIVRKYLFDCWDALFYYLLNLCIDVRSHFTHILYFSFVLNVGVILEMVAFCRLPLVL